MSVLIHFLNEFYQIYQKPTTLSSHADLSSLCLLSLRTQSTQFMIFLLEVFAANNPMTNFGLPLLLYSILMLNSNSLLDLEELNRYFC